MTDPLENKTAQEIIERYRRRTPGSAKLVKQAGRFLPGGDTRTITYYPPYPVSMVSGQGSRLIDVDGHSYLDLLYNYTSLIHGHAHPAITAAAQKQLEAGTALGAANEHQARLAEHLVDRVPGIDQVRFCNSGTEATMLAIRAARAFTGKSVILKMDGGYHGSHDTARVNGSPDMTARDRPASFAEPGVPQGVIDDVVCVPFNDPAAAEEVMADQADRLAAVIVEPLLGAGGLIPPEDGYLEELRALADRYGLLLIFDEIISLRLAHGGLQEEKGIRPDLTCLGKIIGGGFPVGAFGGRQEIMALFDPVRKDPLVHSGTFTGNSVTMVAGLTSLELLDRPMVAEINRFGELLRQGLTRAFESTGIKGRAGGSGSLAAVHWGEALPLNAKQAALGSIAAGSLPTLLHLELMNRGIFAAPRGLFVISTVMTETEINQAVEAFQDALAGLRGLVEEEYPQLLAD